MQDYTTIAGVLRLHEQHLSQREIAARYNIGKGTVARLLEKEKSRNKNIFVCFTFFSKM